MNKLLCYLFLLSSCATQTMAPQNSSAQKEESLQDDLFGIYVIDDKTGEVVQELNAERPFPAASVTKVATAISAIKILGENFQFKTQLKLDGIIKKQKAIGDLYLVGGGDPLLAISDLMTLVQQLKSAGVTSVEGNFYYDQSRFPSQAAITLNSYQNAHYNPAISALSLDFNIDSMATNKAPLANPAQTTANLFKTLCQYEGLFVPTPSEKKAPVHSKVIATHHSAPLKEIISKNLEYSNNLISELIMLEAAKKINPHMQSYQEATKTIGAWIIKKMNLKDSEFFDYPSGSGLSSNSMTPKQMVSILRWGEKEEKNISLIPLLPISGQKGTMKDRLTNSNYQLRVWAKTGTKNYVNTLAGHLYAFNGRKYTFSIFAYDLEKSSLAKDDEDKQDVKDWSKLAKSKIDKILIQLINNKL